MPHLNRQILREFITEEGNNQGETNFMNDFIYDWAINEYM